MKSMTTLFKSVIFLMPFALFLGCELISDDDQDKICKDNKLKSPEDQLVYYYIYFDKYGYYPDNDHVLFNAVSVEFQGTVILKDCYEIASTYHTFERTVYVKESIPPDAITYECHVTQDLLFTFHNNHEYLTIEYTIMAFFEDGAAYTSDVVVKNSDQYTYLHQQTKPIEIYLYVDSSIKWTKIR